MGIPDHPDWFDQLGLLTLALRQADEPDFEGREFDP